jgi:hypothetical protein
MLDGRGGGRIISEGAMVCEWPLDGKFWRAELRFGRGSVSSCIGESKLDEIYLGVGGSAELVVSDM